MIILGSFIKLTDLVQLKNVHASVKMLMGKKKKVAEQVNSAISLGYDKFPFE